jgi:hypothetical protein
MKAGTIDINAAREKMQEEKRKWQEEKKAEERDQPIRATDLQPKNVEWNWHPYLPAGQIVLLAAKGGSGKGLVCTSLAASTTTPLPWPATSETAKVGNVIWCEAEDPFAEVLIPRMIAAGVNLERVQICTPKAWQNIADLRAKIIAEYIRLIVLSPLLSFMPGLTDKNDEMGVRDALQPMQDAIKDTGCTITGICHTTKKADLHAVEKILGAVAFSNYVRCVLLAAPDKEPDEGEERSITRYRLVHAKHNLSPRGNDLIYTPRHTGIQGERTQYVRLDWEVAASNCEVDAIFDRKGGSQHKQTAGDWLAEYLLTEGGEIPREVVIHEGEKAGHKEKALQAAAAKNPKIRGRRAGFQGGSVWWHE